MLGHQRLVPEDAHGAGRPAHDLSSGGRTAPVGTVAADAQPVDVAAPGGLRQTAAGAYPSVGVVKNSLMFGVDNLWSVDVKGPITAQMFACRPRRRLLPELN